MRELKAERVVCGHCRHQEFAVYEAGGEVLLIKCLNCQGVSTVTVTITESTPTLVISFEYVWGGNDWLST